MESTRHVAKNRRASNARCAGPTAGVAMSVLCPAALGAPGDLDPAFADVGRLILPSDTRGAVWSIEAQTDDILLAGGDETYEYYHGFETHGFANRVSSTGALDSGFASPGLSDIEILDIAMQVDGKVVGVGRRRSHSPYPGLELLVFRLGPGGTFDTGFGTNGIRMLSGFHSATSVDVDPGGTIVVAGSQGADLKILRLLENGDPDETFGTAGVFTAAAGSADEQWITAPRILSAEGGGYRVTENIDSTSLVSRCRVLALTASGALDEAFGDAGYAGLLTSTDEATRCSALAQLPDGRILVGGTEGARPFAIRLLTSGDPDVSFAIDALPATDMAEVNALAIDANAGDVLVAGHGASEVPGAMVARLHADGSLDDLFGSGGTAWIDVASPHLWSTYLSVNDVAVQTNGDVLVGGGHEGRPIVARLVGGDGRDGPGVLGVRRFRFAATEGGDAVVTVRRIGGTSGSVTVAYRIVPASRGPFHAAAGEDFSAVSGRLDWADGDASDKEIIVPVAADAGSPEETEILGLELSDPHGGAGLGSNVAWVEIPADGSPAGLFALYDGAVSEGNGTLWVAVYRNYYTTGAVSVTVTPHSETATAGDDFTADAATLSWKDGEGGAKFIEIPINDDSSREPDERFTLELSAATGGALIGPFSAATFSIYDNDTPDSDAGGDSGGRGGGGGRVGFLALLMLGSARAARLRRHGAQVRTTT